MPNYISTVPAYEYQLEHLSWDLATLIDKIDVFERRVSDDIIHLGRRSLVDAGAIARGDYLVIDNVPYRVGFGRTEVTRSATLCVVPWSQEQEALKDSSVKIDHFGRIRTLIISWPECLATKYVAIPHLLAEEYKRAYNSLRAMFVSKYDCMVDRVFVKLYDALNDCALRLGNEHLADPVWFTVTDAKTSQFHYFFSKETLARALDILIADQHSAASPFELAVYLIGREADDTFWAFHIDNKNGFRPLPFSQLTSFFNQPAHWLAENTLYRNSSISAREICHADGQILQANCPEEHAAECNRVVDKANFVLQAEFRQVVKPYRRFKDAVLRIADRLKEGGLLNYEELGARDAVLSQDAKTSPQFHGGVQKAWPPRRR